MMARFYAIFGGCFGMLALTDVRKEVGDNIYVIVRVRT